MVDFLCFPRKSIHTPVYLWLCVPRRLQIHYKEWYREVVQAIPLFRIPKIT